MKNSLKSKKNTYFIILVLVIVISFMQIQILVSELYAIADGAIKASAQEKANNAPKIQPIVKPQTGEVIPNEISIAKIELNLPVINSPLINGSWNTYTDVANYAEGTSGINDTTGNIGIFAHDRAKGFTKIKQLTPGDTIVLKGQNTIASYVVEKSAIANPSDVDVFYATREPKLTLVTCDGTFSEKRYIVTAKLIDIQKDNI